MTESQPVGPKDTELQDPTVAKLVSGQGAAQWIADAEAGQIEAQFVVGHLYLSGIGLPLDLELALRWFRSAAEKGMTAAQIELAKMYEKGLGVSPNPFEAARWYLAAAQLGHRVAQRHVGHLLWEGIGVDPDPDQAVRWWVTAAEKGDAGAKYNLAPLLWRGEAIGRDRRKACRYAVESVRDPVVWAVIRRGIRHKRAVRLMSVVLGLVVLIATLATVWFAVR